MPILVTALREHTEPRSFWSSFLCFALHPKSLPEQVHRFDMHQILVAMYLFVESFCLVVAVVLALNFWLLQKKGIIKLFR